MCMRISEVNYTVFVKKIIEVSVFWMIKWQLPFIISLVVAQNYIVFFILILVIELQQREFPV